MAKESFIDRPFLLPSVVLGLGMFISAVAVSYSMYAIRALDNTLSVTGSAKQNVTADNAKWVISVSHSAYEGSLSSAYKEVERDTAAAISYFKTMGIAPENITANTVSADQDWSYQRTSGEPIRYNVHQEITIQSANVEKIATLAQNTSALLDRGIQATPRQPEYYITNLPELRVSLLSDAVKDARARANSIASSGGGSVGKLKSASSGVVQVLAPNSTNVDDYGSYDTSTVDKVVSVTARAVFLVR